MEEELDLDLDVNEDKKNEERALKRNRDLSDKLKIEAEGREKAETERASALKEVDFYKNFNPLTSKYQGAGEFQDKIREKFMAGYDIEDATVSTLAKEGRLNQESPPPPKESPAGGSAVNAIKAEGEKTVNDMTREEKRAKLMENESEMIDLLSPKIRL